MPEKTGSISPPLETRGPLPAGTGGPRGRPLCRERYYFFSAAGFSAAFSLFSAFFSAFSAFFSFDSVFAASAAGLAVSSARTPNEIRARAATAAAIERIMRAPGLWACPQARLCDGRFQQGPCLCPLRDKPADSLKSARRACRSAAGAFPRWYKSPQFHSHGRRL